MTDSPIRETEVVLVRRRGGEAFLLRALSGPQPVKGVGIVDLSPAIGRSPGTEIRWGGTSYYVLRPALPDLLAQLRRKAQIVTPKDAAYLTLLAGVGPGRRVAEAGAGSGALTLVLAHQVGPTGRVYSFDRREDFLEIARQNLDTSGLLDRVEFAVRDVGEAGFGLTGLDAVVLDLPEPWTVVSHARSALGPGGFLATYTPTYNQLERAVRSIREAEFEEVRSVELLERALHVGEGGTRPEFEMLGHTGFLSSARKGG